MMIITLGSSKGGSGKSTLAANLAAYWAGEGYNVALCDADPNGSLVAWDSFHRADPSGQREGVERPTLHALSAESVSELRTVIAPQYDVVVVDSAGAFGTTEQSIYMMSDFILVPVRPSIFDMTEATKTMKRIDGIRQTLKGMGNSRFPGAAYVVNSIRSGENASAESQQALATMGTVLNTQIGLRAAFGVAAARGVGVSTIEGRRDTKAVAEIDSLANELVQFINEKKEVSDAA